jgi:hypothetical protein
MNDLEKRKFLPLPGLELRPFGRYTHCTIPVPMLHGMLSVEVTVEWIKSLFYIRKTPSPNFGPETDCRD